MRSASAAVGIVCVLATWANAQPPDIDPSVTSKNACLSVTKTAEGQWSVDPRAAVTASANSTSADALDEIRIDGEIEVHCAPPPPPPGSIASAGGFDQLKTLSLASKSKRGGPNVHHLALSLPLDFRKLTSECQSVPFASATAWLMVSAKSGAVTAQRRVSIAASCPGGGDSCLSVPVKSPAKCGAETCGCGLVCCTAITEPEFRCVSEALCRRVKDLHDRH